MLLKGTDNVKVPCSFAKAHPVASCGYLLLGLSSRVVLRCGLRLCGTRLLPGPFAPWAFARPTYAAG
jgi:hypothetical protein